LNERWPQRYVGDVRGVTIETDLNGQTARIAGGTGVPLIQMTAALEADYHGRGGKG